MRGSSKYGDGCQFLFVDTSRVGCMDSHNIDGVPKGLLLACSDTGDLDLHDGWTNAAPGPTHALHHGA